MKYILVFFLCVGTNLGFSQPELEFVNFSSEGNPVIYGQETSKMAITQTDNVYIAGTYVNSMSLTGFSTLNNSNSSRNAYIAKYDELGNGLWTHKLQTSQDGISIRDIKSDNQGNLIITGKLNGSVDFDPGPDVAFVSTPGNPKGFIAKYDPAGNYLWHQEFGSTSWQVYGEALAIDEQNNIYIAGDTGNTLEIGSTTISTPAPTLFAAKFNSNGILAWVETYMKVDSNVEEKITIVDDRLRIMSAFIGLTTNLGSISAEGGNDILLVSINKNSGEFISNGWSTRPYTQVPTKIKSLNNGSVIMQYANYDATTFINSEVRRSDQLEGYIVNQDSFTISAFALGPHEELYLALSGKRTVEYNPVNATIEFSGDPYSYLRKIAPDGTQLWQHKWYATKGHYPASMEISDKNEIYLSGSYIGSSTFEFNIEETEYQASNDRDAYIAKWQDCETQVSINEVTGCSPLEYDDHIFTESDIYQYLTFTENGCLLVDEIDATVNFVDSMITVTDEYIKSNQVGGFLADFEWYDYTNENTINENSNIYYPQASGQYQFNFTTFLGCEYESQVITFPQYSIDNPEMHRTFGVYVHLVNDRFFVSGLRNNLSTVTEYRYNLSGNLLKYSSFGYNQDNIARRVIETDDGVIMSSEKNILRYYKKILTNDIVIDSDIIPPSDSETEVLGFGSSLATYQNFLFVGAPNSGQINGHESVGQVMIYELVDNTWALKGELMSPTQGAQHLFGEEVLIKDNNLIISEAGSQNQNGSGRLHIYNLENWNGSSSTISDDVVSVESTSTYNIGSDITYTNNHIMFTSSNKIYTIPLDNLQESASIILDSDDFNGIGQLKSLGNRLAFTTPDQKFSGSNQVHLFELVNGQLEHTITFYPYTSDSGFGNSYDMNDEFICIGAPTYYSGGDGNSLGKVMYYKYESLPTDVVELDIDSNFFLIFPNPSNQEIHVNYDKSLLPNCHFKIMDLNGNLMTNSTQSIIEIDNLASGVYVLIILEGDRILETQRIIKID